MSSQVYELTEVKKKNYRKNLTKIRILKIYYFLFKSTSQASVKDYENKTNELQHRIDEFNRQILDLNDTKSKLTAQNNELNRRTMSLENDLQQAQLNVKKLNQELEDARMQADNEAMMKTSADNKLRSLQGEFDTLKGQLDEETEHKLDLQRQMLRNQEEYRLDREKHEKENSFKIEEFEDAK